MFDTTPTQANQQFEMVANFKNPQPLIGAIRIVRRHLVEMNARRFAIIAEAGIELWTKDNRIFVIQRDGDFFRLFTSIDFDTMDTALEAIDKFFRIPKIEF
jgi:hypothetical protein